MSLTSALRPSSLTFSSPGQTSDNINFPHASPFHLEPNYLALSRMISRYQNFILLTPAPNATEIEELTPWQKKIQAELWSPLPYHRTKWLRNIEGARMILLQLERSAQDLKSQRAKKDAIRDLAEKRTVIKRLRSRVEEIGREVEAVGNTSAQSPVHEEGETLYDFLQQHRKSSEPKDNNRTTNAATADGVIAIKEGDTQVEPDPEKARDKLLNIDSNVRRRQGKSQDSKASAEEGNSSGWGFSNLPLTEKSLLAASREHEDIAASLVSMAAQLKQQARQFQFSLDQDKGLLDRALEGLDQNVSAMGLASKGMGTLKRMSEEQGFFGRMKLYAIIFGMWIVVILLVFVGPKLRF